MAKNESAASGATDNWWVINGDALRAALQRAHDGDDPGVVYAELYANSTTDEEN